MDGPIDNDPPATDSAKLDQILTQLTTINKRLDSHDLRLARIEKAKYGEDDELIPEVHDTEKPKRRGGGGDNDDGGGDDDDDSRGGGGRDGGGAFNRYNRHDQDDWRHPHRPKLNFPHYDGEVDPLPWLNKCDHYFWGCRTMDEEKVWMASLHLDGVAAEWYYQLERDVGIPSWPSFAEYVNLRFAPPSARMP